MRKQQLKVIGQVETEIVILRREKMEKENKKIIRCDKIFNAY